MRELLILEDFSPASIQKLREAAGPGFHVDVLSPSSEPMLRYAAFRTAEVIIGEPELSELELRPGSAGCRSLGLAPTAIPKVASSPPASS